MKTIEATYRIVTPMFIGDADKSPSDGIRPPSFKGALRFWWRALNWGEFYQKNNGDEAAALKELHQEEARLFGSAVKGKKGGQGVFLLSVTQQPSTQQLIDNWPNGHTESGANSKSGYLGLGLFPMGEHKRRKAIAENQIFKVALGWKPNTSEENKQSVLDACKALGLFGGLGSRSRKGFGSIALETLGDERFQCQNKADYLRFCKPLIHANLDMLPPFSALSPWMRFALGDSKQDARAAHSALANKYLQTRGRGGAVKGKSKIAFGMPLKGYDEARRASPLLMHIHPVGNQFVSSCLFLPADFHPSYDDGGALKFYHGVETFMDKLQEVQL